MLPESLHVLADLLPAAITAVLVVVGLMLARLGLDRAAKKTLEPNVRGNALMLALTIAGLLMVLVMLPINDSTRGQILSFLGILLSATIALSSTTFLGNAMAGLMLRALRNFRPGDFLRVGDHFGRVSERGIFHTEIQTEDRDLTTIPNLHLVNQPVTVIHSSGTVISATVSLGYDVPHGRVEGLLLEAARAAGLRDPFVYVLELGDFSVTYRVAGLLTEVRQLLSSRSKLRAEMLDALHAGGVEIVSPTFMNQRRLDPEVPVIPERAARSEPREPRSDAESLIFDKAEEAASLEQLRDRYRAVAEQIQKLTQSVEGSADEADRERVQARLDVLETRRKRLAELVEKRSE